MAFRLPLADPDAMLQGSLGSRRDVHQAWLVLELAVECFGTCPACELTRLGPWSRTTSFN
jgi:hypothetical protein